MPTLARSELTEHHVEERLRKGLVRHGFEVLKFVTPGTTATMDRLILCPTWAPGSPVVVEVKRPDKAPRPNQRVRAEQWRKRGVDVRPYVDDYETVDALVAQLVLEARTREEEIKHGA